MINSLKHEKILIVDDTPANIQVLNSILAEDYQIIFATNGQEAIEIAEKELPDIILLDIMMPDMDGFTVCKILKAVSLTKDIPIIFITAMDDEDNESYGLELGAIDYITKPIVPSIAKVRVRNHLELKRYRDLLKTQSTLDGLTGVPNRRCFDDYLNREWHRSIRHSTSLSLLLIDIDYFKPYNDFYGHLLGDNSLKQVSHTLSAQLKRSSDLLARYGGEEFACILPQSTLDESAKLAEIMLNAVHNLKIEHANSEISDYLTISMGMSCITPQTTDSMEAFVNFADRLLYQAKEEGRNRIIKTEYLNNNQKNNISRL